MAKKSIICNWKSYFSYQTGVDWCTAHGNELAKLAAEVGESVKIVLCPSFESIATIKSKLRIPAITFGAQDCSAWGIGAHTGEVMATSLREIGCDYCIIGHSERRTDHNESTESTAEKFEQLCKNNIIPIVCIGENAEARDRGIKKETINAQLEPVLQKANLLRRPFWIAYEPVWAIGKEIPANSEVIISTILWLKKNIGWLKMDDQIKIIYGGSVNQATIESLLATPVDGFLIGKATTDFQEVKKIVSSLKRT